MLCTATNLGKESVNGHGSTEEKDENQNSANESSDVDFDDDDSANEDSNEDEESTVEESDEFKTEDDLYVGHLRRDCGADTNRSQSERNLRDARHHHHVGRKKISSRSRSRRGGKRPENMTTGTSVNSSTSQNTHRTGRSSRSNSSRKSSKSNSKEDVNNRNPSKSRSKNMALSSPRKASSARDLRRTEINQSRSENNTDNDQAYQQGGILKPKNKNERSSSQGGVHSDTSASENINRQSDKGSVILAASGKSNSIRRIRSKGAHIHTDFNQSNFSKSILKKAFSERDLQFEKEKREEFMLLKKVTSSREECVSYENNDDNEDEKHRKIYNDNDDDDDDDDDSDDGISLMSMSISTKASSVSGNFGNRRARSCLIITSSMDDGDSRNRRSIFPSDGSVRSKSLSPRRARDGDRSRPRLKMPVRAKSFRRSRRNVHGSEKLSPTEEEGSQSLSRAISESMHSFSTQESSMVDSVALRKKKAAKKSLAASSKSSSIRDIRQNSCETSVESRLIHERRMSGGDRASGSRQGTEKNQNRKSRGMGILRALSNPSIVSQKYDKHNDKDDATPSRKGRSTEKNEQNEHRNRSTSIRDLRKLTDKKSRKTRGEEMRLMRGALSTPNLLLEKKNNNEAKARNADTYHNDKQERRCSLSEFIKAENSQPVKNIKHSRRSSLSNIEGRISNVEGRKIDNFRMKVSRRRSLGNVESGYECNTPVEVLEHDNAKSSRRSNPSPDKDRKTGNNEMRQSRRCSLSNADEMRHSRRSSFNNAEEMRQSRRSSLSNVEEMRHSRRSSLNNAEEMRHSRRRSLTHTEEDSKYQSGSQIQKPTKSNMRNSRRREPEEEKRNRNNYRRRSVSHTEEYHQYENTAESKNAVNSNKKNSQRKSSSQVNKQYRRNSVGYTEEYNDYKSNNVFQNSIKNEKYQNAEELKMSNSGETKNRRKSLPHLMPSTAFSPTPSTPSSIFSGSVVSRDDSLPTLMSMKSEQSSGTTIQRQYVGGSVDIILEADTDNSTVLTDDFSLTPTTTRIPINNSIIAANNARSRNQVQRNVLNNTHQRRQIRRLPKLKYAGADSVDGATMDDSQTTIPDDGCTIEDCDDETYGSD